MNIKTTKLNIATFSLLLISFILTSIISLSPFIAHASTEGDFYVSTYYAIPSGNNLILKGHVSYPPKHTKAWFRWGETSSMNYSTTPVRLSYISYRRELDLSKKISNVKKNTKYYYQLVTETLDGNRTYGKRLSTTTKWDGKDTLPKTELESIDTTIHNTGTQHTDNTTVHTTTSPTLPVAITLLPSPVFNTSMIMKGLALPGSAISTEGWFEWGTTQSLGKETRHKNIVGNTRSILFSSNITGLSSNTVYYYRAVIQNENGVSYGNILNIKTTIPRIAEIYKANSLQNPQKTIAKKDKIKDASLASVVSSKNSSFMPDTLIGWLALLLLILGILALSDYLFEVRKKRKNTQNN